MLLSSPSRPDNPNPQNLWKKWSLENMLHHTCQLKLGADWFHHRHSGAAHIFRQSVLTNCTQNQVQEVPAQTHNWRYWCSLFYPTWSTAPTWPRLPSSGNAGPSLALGERLPTQCDLQQIQGKHRRKEHEEPNERHHVGVPETVKRGARNRHETQRGNHLRQA